MLFSLVMKKSIKFRPALAWLIFSCLLFCSVPLFAKQTFSSTDSVFCPLQKTWVKRSHPDAEARRNDNSLEEICAPVEYKQHFIDDLAKSFFSRRIERAQVRQEQLFFQYLEKGRQAFAEIAPFNSSPEHQLIKAASKEKSGMANYQADFHRKIPEAFNLKVLARPPTFSCTTIFDFQFALELKKISRSINPRSPPVSI